MNEMLNTNVGPIIFISLFNSFHDEFIARSTYIVIHKLTKREFVELTFGFVEKFSAIFFTKCLGK